MLTWRQLERGACTLLGFIHCTLGLAVLSGGGQRFPPPNYTPLVEAANGSIWVYGLVWLVGGALMLTPSIPARLIGVGINTLLSNVWAALFAVAAFRDLTASYTPTAAYGGYGLLNAVLFALMIMHLRRKNEGA